ncbi:MAG: hypothetical protein IPL84_12965 [Chitinophagaceae bacterium]|nr:hypothetical protein [Chitinophagaceae bacterium]
MKDAFNSGDPVLVPLYDEKGAVYKYELFAGETDPGKFTAIELTQDWYYDAKRNQLTNKITEARLFAKKRTDAVETSEALPVLKLVFK